MSNKFSAFTGAYSYSVFMADFETQNKITPKGDVISRVVAYAYSHSFNYWKDDDFLTYIDDDKITYNDSEYVRYYDNYGKDVINEFLDEVIRKSTKKRNIWYFHNLKNFDGFFIKPALLKRFKFNSFASSFVELRKGEWMILVSGNQILSITLKISDKKIIEFRDTLSYFLSSIENMGDFLGFPKLELIDNDYNLDLESERKNKSAKYYKFVDYTKRDVLILKKYVLTFIKTNNWNILKKITNAGFSFFNAIEDIADEEVKKHVLEPGERKFWEQIHTSYYGGYTHLNRIYSYVVVDGIRYIDINSSYPNIMRGYLPLYVVDKKKDATNPLVLFRIKILSGKLKKGKTPIIRNPWLKDKAFKAYGKENVFIDEIHTPFNYTIWEDELAYFKKFYDDFKYKITKTFIYESGTPFKEFIETLFKKRNQAKEKSKDKSLDEAIRKELDLYQTSLKIQLNGCYGKTAKNIKNDMVAFVPFKQSELKSGMVLFYNKRYETWHKTKNDVVDIEDDYEEYTISNVKKEVITGECEVYLENISMKGVYNNAIGSYITSAARVRLFEVIDKLGDDFIYCDTDSIIYKNTNKVKLDEGSELGQWKEEMNNMFFLGFRSKQYVISPTREIVEDKIKWTIAGSNEFKEIEKNKVIYKTLDDLAEYGFSAYKNAARVNMGGKMIDRKVNVIKSRDEKMKGMKWQ